MNLKHEAHETKKLLRKKRSRYRPVDNEMREKLINMVNIEKYRLKKASEILLLNYNTAKTILRVWKKESRIKKKKKKKNYFKTKLNISKDLKDFTENNNNNNINNDIFEKFNDVNSAELALKRSRTNKRENLKNKRNSEFSFNAACEKEKVNSQLNNKIKKTKKISKNDTRKKPNQLLSCGNFNSKDYLNETFIDILFLNSKNFIKNRENFNCNDQNSDRFFAKNRALNSRLIRSSFFDLKSNSFSFTYLNYDNINEFSHFNGGQTKSDSKYTKDFSSSPKNNNLKTNTNDLSSVSLLNHPSLFSDDFTKFNEIVKTNCFSIINPKFDFKFNLEYNDIEINNFKNLLFNVNCEDYFSFNFKDFFDKYIYKNSITIENINSELHLNSESKCVLGNLLSKIIKMENNFSQVNKNITRISHYLLSLFVMLFPFD